MASDEINERNKKPLGSIYGGNSAFNATQQQIDTSIQELETAFIAKVTSCESSGVGGSKTVNAVPMVQMIDANGNTLQSPDYVKLPHYRVQQGIAALIIDPVPDDLGVFVSCKRDISNINSSSTNPMPPASLRSFNGADSVMVGTIHTKEPTVYIQITQDNKILIHAPAGCTVESDTEINIKAPTVNIEATSVNVKASNVSVDSPETTLNGHLTVQGGITVSGGGGSSMTGDFTLNGSMNATNDVTASGISLNSHVHGGITAGGSDTSTPK
jgi:hypothetical protein